MLHLGLLLPRTFEMHEDAEADFSQVARCQCEGWLCGDVELRVWQQEGRRRYEAVSMHQWRRIKQLTF